MKIDGSISLDLARVPVSTFDMLKGSDEVLGFDCTALLEFGSLGRDMNVVDVWVVDKDAVVRTIVGFPGRPQLVRRLLMSIQVVQVGDHFVCSNLQCVAEMFCSELLVLQLGMESDALKNVQRKIIRPSWAIIRGRYCPMWLSRVTGCINTRSCERTRRWQRKR